LTYAIVLLHVYNLSRENEISKAEFTERDIIPNIFYYTCSGVSDLHNVVCNIAL